MKSEGPPHYHGQILSGCAVRAALQQGPSLRDALRTIYEDIPARPNMTEAGRVAMMAETARAALDSHSHETNSLPDPALLNEIIKPVPQHEAEAFAQSGVGYPAEKANDPLAQLEDDATFGAIVEEIQAQRGEKSEE